jgi:ubiquitin-conjugating enzyme E2 N
MQCAGGLIEPPVSSPFAGGVFALVISLPKEYPATPPTIVFETPVYHCNVSEAGAVCLDLLREKWTDAFTVLKALEAVRLLLAHPSPDDALRQWIAELTIADRNSNGADRRYADAAVAATRKDASRSIAEWQALWGC